MTGVERRKEGNGERECCGVAGHENKIKFPISSASLLGLSRQKAVANFANNTQRVQLQQRGGGDRRVSVLGVACNTHIHTYVGEGMSAAT